MAYTLIQGRFVSTVALAATDAGRKPNAGTIHFRPTQPELLKQWGDFLEPQELGTVEVRLEGVEALETGFKNNHQCLPVALAARRRLLQILELEQPDALGETGPYLGTAAESPGYLLARNIDDHGRVIAFAYSGSATEADGARVFVKPDRVNASANALLLREGLAYASFYDSLPADLRTGLAELPRRARGYNLGLWPKAVAMPGRRALIPNARALGNLVVFPKLFRRLVEYFAGGHLQLDAFRDWLAAYPHRNDTLLLPSQELGSLHQMIEVQGNHLRLTRNPEDFVVLKSQAPNSSGRARETSQGPLRIVAALLHPLDVNLSSKSITILNTSARSVALNLFTLRDKRGTALPLDGQLEPGEAKRIGLGQLAHSPNEANALALCHGARVVDRVAYTRSQAMQRGVALVF
jgi:hypothetical protein